MVDIIVYQVDKGEKLIELYWVLGGFYGFVGKVLDGYVLLKCLLVLFGVVLC